MKPKGLKLLYIFSSLIAVLAVFIGLNVNPVYAAQAVKEQDGLQVTMTTDKDDYGKEENIKAVFNFQNNSDVLIKEVQLSNEVPTGYTVVENEITQQIGEINPGETKQANVTYMPVVETPVDDNGNEQQGEDTNDDNSKQGEQGQYTKGGVNGQELKSPDNKTDNDKQSSVKRLSANTAGKVVPVDNNSSKVKSPGTGDYSRLPVWAIVAICATAGITLSVIVVK